jgi:hypothetical protein
LDPQLRAGIQAWLVQWAATAQALMLRATTPKMYEVYVLSLVARALDNIGAQLEPRDIGDQVTNDLQFRLGPGRIYSPATTPGFVHVNYHGREYEIQNGVQVLGKSKILHELDICIIKRDKAVRCRQRSIDPSGADTKLVIECKFYGAALDLALGREFLGLLKEFSVKVRTMVSNLSNDNLHTLITKHDGTENFLITPINGANADRFVQWLANEFRQVLA